MRSIYTFGDSVLDCARYNDHEIDPVGLLVSNRDDLFPEFRGLDLTTRFGEVSVVRRAVDGSTVADLPAQVENLAIEGPAMAVVTCGGNDLIRGFREGGLDVGRFIARLSKFLDALPIRPVYLGTVYDPTFGDDATYGNILRLSDPSRARANFETLNTSLAALATKYGALVDLHAHFLKGRPDWFVRMIEPSLEGASEVRRCLLDAIAAHPHP